MHLYIAVVRCASAETVCRRHSFLYLSGVVVAMKGQ